MVYLSAYSMNFKEFYGFTMQHILLGMNQTIDFIELFLQILNFESMHVSLYRYK